MTMNQVPLPESSSNFTKHIQVLLYPYEEERPKAIKAVFEGNRRHAQRRYLFADAKLRWRETQAYVHDILTTSKYNGRKYTFRVFFKRYKGLPKNQAIRALANAANAFEGDVLVAAIGPDVGLRNLNTALQRRAANNAVAKLSRRLTPFRKKRFPARITL
ncbi:uncharacterized protein SCHCODRAFT_02495829 [Schizophyllum commune H4-8]|uniref:Uncharacterized protein n=1 Tax=Schizophyllum commune (strain H4-8 / FGSC 9210) TaxID=578458 RepID=D8Q2E4_SCHCM|nr:uncharacterized protein SCHCODRAFT_02495829 [Schizophyllum commune H4-8]KAI5895832.1 hypothetical protein SCHCODRAFT_02495829 [Schizophyllum commune H4-8]